MVLVRILERSPPTHTHRPVLRRYAHGGGRGTCAVHARTASRRALSEYARTYHGTHGTAAPIGYYTLSQRGRRVLGGDSRAYSHRGRSGAVRARAARGASDTVLKRQSEHGPSSSLLAGYSEGTRGVLTSPCVERSARGSGTGRARHSQRGRAEHEHARGYCERYRVPHGAGPLAGAAAGVLTAACGEGTRTEVRRCVQAHAGALTDTNGQALALTRTARHRARCGRTGQSAA